MTIVLISGSSRPDDGTPRKDAAEGELHSHFQHVLFGPRAPVIVISRIKRYRPLI